jgi:hypothetical protein
MEYVFPYVCPIRNNIKYKTIIKHYQALVCKIKACT